MMNGRKSSEYGQSWAVVVTMLDGPKTFSEIIEHFQTVKRRFGIFDDSGKHQQSFFDKTLDGIIKKGWVEEFESKYRLTPEGRKEAEKAYNEITVTRDFVHNKLINPVVVSKITLIVHFILALIKVPIGIISGSVGLLNDGIDTLLDGLSSSLVYFGIKFNREKTINKILIIIMFITGLYTLYQAVKRIFISVENSIDWLTFTAVIFSALISLILMVYQRYVGVKKNNFSLIIQSIDSRNHIIVAVGVIIGMSGSLLNYGILDTLVGIAVSILILKGAVELLLELLKGEEDTSHFSMFNFSNKIYNKRLQNWMLRQVKNQKITRYQLIENGISSLNFENNITLESVGLHKQHNIERKIKEAVDNLIRQGYIFEGKELELSDEGIDRIQSINPILNSNYSFKNLLNYFIILPLSLISFIFLYYLSLAGLSFLPFADLWQKIDIYLFNINFPLIDTVYMCTLMNIIHFSFGFCMYIYAIYHFINITIENHNARDPETRKPFKLNTEGYYGKVRHPMYGMMILIYIAFFFALKSWLSLIIGLILITNILINGWYEEKFVLMRLFGEEYREYKDKTKNWFFDRNISLILIILILISLLGVVLI